MATCCALFVVTHLNIPMNQKPVKGVVAFHRNRSKLERGSSGANKPESEDTLRRTYANYPGPNGGFSGTARNPYASTEYSKTIPTIRLQDLYGPRTHEKPVGLSTVKPHKADPVATGFKPESLAEKPTQADPVATGFKPESLAEKPTQADSVAKDRSLLSQENSPPPSDSSSHVCGRISSDQAREMNAVLANILEQTQAQNQQLLEMNSTFRKELGEVKTTFRCFMLEFEKVQLKLVEVLNVANDLKREVADLSSKQNLQESPVDVPGECGSQKSFDAEDLVSTLSSHTDPPITADNGNLPVLSTPEQDGGIGSNSETSDDIEIAPETHEISPQTVAQLVVQEDPMHPVPVQRFIHEMPGFLSAKFSASGSDSGIMPAFWGLVSKYDLYRDVYNAFLDISDELGKLSISVESDDVFKYEKMFDVFSEINVAPDLFDSNEWSKFKKEKGVGVAITTKMIPDGRPETYVSKFKKTDLDRTQHPKKFAKAAIMAYFKWGTDVSKRFKEKLDALGPLGD